MDHQQESSLFDLHLDEAGQSSLLSISKWARFVAVTGIIIGSILLVLALAYGSEIVEVFAALLSIGSKKGTTGMLVLLLIAAIMLVAAWLYFLLRTATLLNNGLESHNTELLAAGFRAMKTYFVISFILSLLSILSAITEIF